MMIATHINFHGPDGEVKRDSMCTVVSVNSALSLEYLPNPNEIIAELERGDEKDGVNRDEPDFYDYFPVKSNALLNGFEFDDEEMPSRKRRASHRDAREDSDLFQNDVVFDDEDETLFDDETIVCFERDRAYSAERRRIQSELLSRLEFLDGVQMEEVGEAPPNHEIVYENNDARDDDDENDRSTRDDSEIKFDDIVIPVENGKNDSNEQPPRPEDPEPRLGIYNEKERIERLNAYREKRKRRVYGKVRYVLRQRVSESRPRVKGRFVKQNDRPTPINTDQESDPAEDTSPTSASTRTSTSSPVRGTQQRRVEFKEEAEEEIPIRSAESTSETTCERRRSIWEMFKSLALVSPRRVLFMRSKLQEERRPSLPCERQMSWSEKLLRRKSTTAASTISGRAKRVNSRYEMFSEDEIDEQEEREEPERKRALTTTSTATIRIVE